MVDLGNNDDCWSSEEEELNFGGTMGVAGVAAIRSATFVESQHPAAHAHALHQPGMDFTSNAKTNDANINDFLYSGDEPARSGY